MEGVCCETVQLGKAFYLFCTHRYLAQLVARAVRIHDLLEHVAVPARALVVVYGKYKQQVGGLDVISR